MAQYASLGCLLQSLVLNEELRSLCVGHDREREQWRREQEQVQEQVQDLQEERRWEERRWQKGMGDGGRGGEQRWGRVDRREKCYCAAVVTR